MEFRLGEGLFYDDGDYLGVSAYNLGISEFRCATKQVGDSCDDKDETKGKCALVHSMKILQTDLTSEHEGFEY